MKTPATPHTSTLSAIVFTGILFLATGCQRGDDINDIPPVAKFTYTSQATLPVLATFNNTSVEPAGNPCMYVWDFGDGSTVSGIAAPTHYYVHPGTYMVTLVQVPTTGSNDSLRRTLLIPAAGPSGNASRLQTANFEIATSFGYKVSFTNTSTDASSYLWEFGDGATSTTDSTTVTHTYTAGNTYHVRLKANGTNLSDTCGATITF